MEDWISLAKECGYEGSALFVQNEDGELLFVLGTKGQAEVPGGKPEAQDGGDPRATALRELREETGLELGMDAFADDSCIKTMGGTTGMPSHQYFSTPQSSKLIDGVKLEAKYTKAFWSKLVALEGLYYVQDEEKLIPLRKFNSIVVGKNLERFAPFFVSIMQ